MRHFGGTEGSKDSCLEVHLATMLNMHDTHSMSV